MKEIKESWLSAWIFKGDESLQKEFKGKPVVPHLWYAGLKPGDEITDGGYCLDYSAQYMARCSLSYKIASTGT